MRISQFIPALGIYFLLGTTSGYALPVNIRAQGQVITASPGNSYVSVGDAFDIHVSFDNTYALSSALDITPQEQREYGTVSAHWWGYIGSNTFDGVVDSNYSATAGSEFYGYLDRASISTFGGSLAGMDISLTAVSNVFGDWTDNTTNIPIFSFQTFNHNFSDPNGPNLELLSYFGGNHIAYAYMGGIDSFEAQATVPEPNLASILFHL